LQKSAKEIAEVVVTAVSRASELKNSCGYKINR
jgi:hypothetical protein